MTHTEAPWALGRIHEEKDLRAYLDGDGAYIEINGFRHQGLAFVVWRMGGDDRSPHEEANAAFIVRACNAHDDLVKALENILNTSSDKESFYVACDEARATLNRIRLAKASHE